MTTRLSQITDAGARREQALRNMEFDDRGEPIPGEELWTEEDSRLQIDYILDEADEQRRQAAIWSDRMAVRYPDAEGSSGGSG